MKYKSIRLTPEIAAEWLGTMPEYQRKPSPQVVAEYAADMENGEVDTDEDGNPVTRPSLKAK